MNNFVDAVFRMASNMVEDEEKGIINKDDIFSYFTQMSYLDYCLMFNSVIYETFVVDNNESIKSLRKKLSRRDDIEQKIILIKAEKEKIIQYLESEDIANDIAISNKPITEFFEFMKGKYEQTLNNPDMRDMFDDEEGKELKIKADIFIESADRFLEVDKIEDVELPVIFKNQPELLTLSSPDEIHQELKKQEFDDFSQLIPSNFLQLGETQLIDSQDIMDNSYKLLFIHSQEEYFEMLREEEIKLKKEYGLIEEEKVGDNNIELESNDTNLDDDNINTENTITIDLPNFPRTKNRRNGDGLTCLSRERTALLIDTLREVKVFLDEDLQPNINVAKALQVLTGFSFNRLRTDLTAIPSKEDLLATQNILQNAIDLIVRQLNKR